EGRGRQIESRHPGAQPRQAQRVRADVALQVQGGEPRDVAQPRSIESHDLAQELRVVDEPLNLIPVRRRVGGSPVIPVGAIDGEVVVGHALHPAFYAVAMPGPTAYFDPSRSGELDAATRALVE